MKKHKKILAVLLSMIMLFSMAACSAGTDNSTTSDDTKDVPKFTGENVDYKSYEVLSYIAFTTEEFVAEMVGVEPSDFSLLPNQSTKYLVAYESPEIIKHYYDVNNTFIKGGVEHEMEARAYMNVGEDTVYVIRVEVDGDEIYILDGPEHWKAYAKAPEA